MIEPIILPKKAPAFFVILKETAVVGPRRPIKSDKKNCGLMRRKPQFL
ncbi:hypothetical protein EVA_09553 [gut metagenome]|uniref:Uncharacterized protein n=1 Tax=gut metagenome TaxID=749906 RepID=J9CQC7_9ZZZZ